MNPNIVKPKTLSGFMELLPKEQLQFNKIKAALERVYGLYGFYPLDTPVLEYAEILFAKAGGETEKQVYRFTKGDTDLAMRFDLTVPLAKYVAKNYSELTFPFKRYQIGKVYRGERAQKGRFREFYQSDIDIIGDGELSTINDAEIPSIIYNIFTELGLDDFTIRINNRKVLSGFFAMLSLDEKAGDIMRAVDKIEKLGRDTVLRELLELEIDGELCEKILGFIEIKGENEQIIEKLRALSDGNELFENGVGELELVAKCIDAFDVPRKNYRIDLSIARGLDYYTGTVYETTFNTHPEIGSICSGGRYDNLAGYYTEKQLPGVGISIGLTRLFYILNEMNYIGGGANSPADVLIIPMTDELSHAIGASSVLRKSGIRTQIYFENKKFKHRIGYADKQGIPFAVFLGEEEIAQNMVKLKNMISGEQSCLTISEAVQVISEYLMSASEVKMIDINR
ncbi:MAG: histidine--tRNA ligase [Oscillospiraceae bacterium]